MRNHTAICRNTNFTGIEATPEKLVKGDEEMSFDFAGFCVKAGFTCRTLDVFL